MIFYIIGLQDLRTPKELIKTGLTKAFEIQRHPLLCVKEIALEQILPFISTHYLMIKILFWVVKQNGHSRDKE